MTMPQAAIAPAPMPDERAIEAVAPYLEGLGYKGATVVLTGGSSGIGRATAEILLKLGAKVHVVDVAPVTLEGAIFHRCDLGDFTRVRSTARSFASSAPIDFVFSCAGLAPQALGALQCMRVNYVGTRLLIECLLPSLRDGAAIAVISSDAAMGWSRNLSLCLEMLAIEDPDAAIAWVKADWETRLRDGYTSSKEMLAVWVQHAAVKLGQERRIRLNAIAPCPTRTAFMDLTEEAIGADFFANWPFPSLGRMSTSFEQAWPLVLLSSPLNRSITGTLLYTDQGFAAGVETGAINSSIEAGGRQTG